MRLSILLLLNACQDAPQYAIHAPCAQWPDNEVVFPDTAVGVQTAYRPFLLVNVGETTSLSANRISWVVEGPDAADFTVDNDSHLEDISGFCRNRESPAASPKPFMTGAFCRVDFVFHPSTVGEKRAALRLMGGVVEPTFPVHGTAVEAPAAVYASAPDIYLRHYGIRYPQFGFMITNGGSTSVALGEPIVTPPWVLGRVETGNGPWSCPSSLTPGASCYVGLPNGQDCTTGTFTTSTGAIEIPLTAFGI